MANKIQPQDEIPPEVLNHFGGLLESLLQGRAFSLIISTTLPDGKNSTIQYVSNVPPGDMQTSLELFLAKWRGGN